MASLKAIRRRISSVRSTQQITRAMKLVAAARLKKATDRVLEARPYSEKLRELIPPGFVAEIGLARFGARHDERIQFPIGNLRRA